MYKAFEIAGYGPEVVEEKFGGMLNAMKFGAPPHGGSAPGVDRMVMLLADEPNIREVIPFPMNGRAEDLMMGALGGIARTTGGVTYQGEKTTGGEGINPYASRPKREKEDRLDDCTPPTIT